MEEFRGQSRDIKCKIMNGKGTEMVDMMARKEDGCFQCSGDRTERRPGR